jgi:choline dehydrogenase-like flavoprotein
VEGGRFDVSAKLFILALGGIDTPRLLLLSNRHQSCGLGNQNDLVGRFFMEHLHFWSGFYLPNRPDTYAETALYRIHKAKSVSIMGKLTLSEDTSRREKLANYCVSLLPRVLSDSMPAHAHQSEGVKSLRVLRAAMSDGHLPDDFSGHWKNMVADFGGVATAARKKALRGWERLLHKQKKNIVYQLDQMTEQIPNPASRITLSNERDALGRKRVRLDWKLSPLDIHSVIRAQEILDEEVRAAGLGSLRIDLKDENNLPEIVGGWHHMGTTRMHADPRKGVVDEDCRVHDMSNLFIAGPSVFPTGGYANPVLTIVALAARLADHIKTLMK